MSRTRPIFGLRTVAAAGVILLAGSASFGRGESLAHSDVPDLPSVLPITGGKDGWTGAPGKTPVKFENGPISIGDLAGEDIDLENTPPPALTSFAPIVPSTSGPLPTGSVPSSSSGISTIVVTPSSSIPSPAGFMVFGMAAALGARRRR